MKNLILFSVTLILFSTGSASVQQRSGVSFELGHTLGMRNGTPMDIHFVPMNVDTMTHLIAKRDTTDGLLKAKQIQAKQLKTQKLKANRIKADRIKSDIIISDTIIVTAGRKKSKSEPERNFGTDPKSSRDRARDIDRQMPAPPSEGQTRSSRRQDRARDMDRQMPASLSEGQTRSSRRQDRARDMDRQMPAPLSEDSRVLDLTRYKQPVKIDIHLPDSKGYETMRAPRIEPMRAPRIEPMRAPRVNERDGRPRAISNENRRRFNDIQHDVHSNQGIVVSNNNDLQGGLDMNRRRIFDAVQNVSNEPRRKSKKRKSRRDRQKDRDLIGFKQQVMPVYRRLDDMHGREFVDSNTYRSMDIQGLGTRPMHTQTYGAESGVLRARDISAGSIKTRLMNADSITADHIRGKRVNARNLNVEEQLPVQMAYFMNSPEKASGHLENNLLDKHHLTSSQSGFHTTTDSTMSPFNTEFSAINRDHVNVADTNQRESVSSHNEVNPFVQSKAKRFEKFPNLELLGISTLNNNQPELQMYVETPIRKQRTDFRDQYSHRQSSTVLRQVAQEQPSFAEPASINRDRFAPRSSQSDYIAPRASQSEFIAPRASQSEYITDNYRSLTKSVNSIKDFTVG